MSETESGAEPRESRRFHLKFGLRAIFLLTLVVAAYFAGRGPAERRAAESQLASELAEEKAKQQTAFLGTLLSNEQPDDVSSEADH